MAANALAPRATAFVAGAQNVHFSNPTLAIAGRDSIVHNHHYNQPKRPKTLEDLFELIPNFRQIYQDMLSKATPGTGMWLIEGDKFRVWLDPNGTIKIFWGSGIRK